MAAVMKFAATLPIVMPPGNIRITEMIKMAKPEMTVIELFFRNAPASNKMVKITINKARK